eukprot:scaffold162333_cov23-Tisochrysis_lutea.AAC.1
MRLEMSSKGEQGHRQSMPCSSHSVIEREVLALFCVQISNGGNTTTTDPEIVASSFANGVCSNAVQHINVTVYYRLADSNSVEATIERVCKCVRARACMCMCVRPTP